jgi:hypothetical protein
LGRNEAKGVEETKEGVISGPTYQGKGPEKQEKIEELLNIRDGYRRQRRIWYWLLAFSFLSAYILMNRGGSRTMLYGMICLAVGLYPLWNIIKCNRIMKKIDQGLAPYKRKDTKLT